MATYRYTGESLELGGELQIRVSDGQTVEIPDEYAAQFDADERFTSSRAKNPDIVPDVVSQPTEPFPAS